MELEPSVTRVADQLAAAAALGDERTQLVAAALGSAAAPAVRLAVLDALAAAAEEINARLLDLPGTPTVSVRLDGDDARIDVHITTEAVQPPDDPAADDGDVTARISLRLSDALKSRVDAAARNDGVSVNTWLVRAAAAALHARTTDTATHPRRADSRRITGWIN